MVMLFIIKLLFVYKIIVLVRCVLSWIQLDSNNPVIRFIYEITDPLLNSIREVFPMLVTGGIDFSPIILLFGIHFVENMLRNLFL